MKRTPSDIIADAKSRNVIGDLPNPETLKQYKLWKPELPKKIISSILAYHSQQRIKDNAELAKYFRHNNIKWVVRYIILFGSITCLFLFLN